MTILVLMGLALAYALLMLNLHRRLTDQDADSDEEALSLLALQCECSVFDLFFKAGEPWSFSKAKISADFNRYLRQGVIPHYLIAYVRQQAPSRRDCNASVLPGRKMPPNANA